MGQLRHTKVIGQMQAVVSDLRARAAVLRQIAVGAQSPSPHAGDGLFREAERAALRLELLAAELEPMLSAEQEDPAAERKRLLLVERRAQLARAFAAVLAQRFELVGVVSRGREAIERLSRVCVDVIVVGEQLGGEMTAAQLLAFVRAHWPSVRRVLHAEGEALPAGDADVVLRRPASPMDVVAAIERLS